MPFASQAAGEAQLRAGKLDALYVGRPRGADQAGARPGGERHQGQVSPERSPSWRARALAPAAASTSRPLPVRGLKRAPTSLSTRLTGMAVVVLIYLLIFIYGQRITSGVVEEKSSRVVEVLLASVRPAQLLTGKVIGMGATAFGQVAALVATFLIVGGGDRIGPAARGGDRRRARRRAVDGARLRPSLHRVRRRRLADHARVRCRQRHLPGRAAAAVRLRAVVRDHLRRLEQRPVRGPRLHPAHRADRLHDPVRDRQHRARPGGGLGRHLRAHHGGHRPAGGEVYERSILRTGARVRLREALRAER